MSPSLSRRRLVAQLGAGLAATCSGLAVAQAVAPPWLAAPIGWPGRVPGDGFRIGHGYACENTWFAPGWWHTGEDWYAVEGNSAGAEVYALAEGTVAYAGFDYPGRVVIIEHGPQLYAMYGHLDPAMEVAEGDVVGPGKRLGTLLDLGLSKGDGRAPSHLHFELRTFLIRDDVNGANPGFGVNCGVQCPPGPGYWPIDAPQHPSDMGWLNPTHTRFTQALSSGSMSARILIPDIVMAAVPVRSAPELDAEITDELAPGTSVALTGLRSGEPSSDQYGAMATEAWIETDGGWIQSFVPSDAETGSDGEPSSLDLALVITAVG